MKIECKACGKKFTITTPKKGEGFSIEHIDGFYGIQHMIIFYNDMEKMLFKYPTIEEFERTEFMKNKALYGDAFISVNKS